MGRDAERALAEALTGSPWQAWAQLLLGIARLLAGDPDAADHHLADAAEVGRTPASTRPWSPWPSGPCWP